MDISTIKTIKKKYIEALAKSNAYNDIIVDLYNKKENEPISNFKVLNQQQIPSYSNESRELQEILLDLNAINTGIIEMKDYADSIITNVDKQIEETTQAIEDESSRIDDVNMLCNDNGDFNMVTPMFADDFSDESSGGILNNKTLSAKELTITEIDYTISSVYGNGIQGNLFVYNNKEFENATNDYSAQANIQDESEITAYEYERLITNDRLEAIDKIINYDEKDVECIITLETSTPTCLMKVISDTEDLTIKGLQVSDDGVTWTDAITREIKPKNKNKMYYDNTYIYGSDFVCYPYTNYVRVTFSSSKVCDDTIAIADDNGNVKTYINTKRKKVRLNKILLYATTYESVSVTSKEMMDSESIDKIALFSTEYVAEHLGDITNYVTYYLIINGKEYEIVPINSGRDGIKKIKYSETVDTSYDINGVTLIEETIKSAKVKIVIYPNSTTETPFISNLKLCVGKSTGNIYV